MLSARAIHQRVCIPMKFLNTHTFSHLAIQDAVMGQVLRTISSRSQNVPIQLITTAWRRYKPAGSSRYHILGERPAGTRLCVTVTLRARDSMYQEELPENAKRAGCGSYQSSARETLLQIAIIDDVRRRPAARWLCSRADANTVTEHADDSGPDRERCSHARARGRMKPFRGKSRTATEDKAPIIHVM